MKHLKKTVVAVLLSAAMLCGMIFPVGAWGFIEQSILYSPNGVIWFDMQNQVEWLCYALPEEGDPIAIYSFDSVIWYTAQGLADYCGLTNPASVATLTEQTLSSAMRSPDAGNLWLDQSAVFNWYEWGSYWNQQCLPVPEQIYHVPGTYFYSTEPLLCPSSQVYTTSQLGLSGVSGRYAYIHFNADSNFYGVVLAAGKSTNANPFPLNEVTDWKAMLTDEDFSTEPYGVSTNPTMVAKYSSYNPYQHMFTYGYRVPLSGDIVINDSSYPPREDCGVLMRTVFLRATQNCTVDLNIGHNLPASVYSTVLFRGVSGDNFSGDVSSITQFMDAYGIQSDTPYSPIYYPLRPQYPGTVMQDDNLNGIIDYADQDAAMLLDLPVQVNGGNGNPSGNIVPYMVQLQEGVVYALDFLFWAEGQSPMELDSLIDGYFYMTVERHRDSNEQFLYPLYYVSNNSGVTITGFEADYLQSFYYGGASGDISGCGVCVDPQTNTLTLPQTINGQPVTEIGEDAFTDPMFSMYTNDMTIVLPNTVQFIYDHAFLPIVSRIHVPFDAQVSPEMILNRTGATICCDAPNSHAEQMLSFQGNYQFLVCTEHGTSHVHSFLEWEVTTEATCITNGEQMRTCTRCGVTETETVPAQGHAYNAEVTEPTCTTVGFTTYTCSRCGESYTADETDALGHSYDAVVTEPTCTTGGFTTYTCTRCGDTYVGDETDALGHDFGNWVVTTAATVDAQGEETRYCARCDAAETRPIDKLPVAARLSVTGGRAKPGDTVQVTVSVSENAGLVAAMLKLQYDPQILTLTAVDNGTVFRQDVFQAGGDYSVVPFTVIWTDALATENNTSNGTLVTFTFTVKAGAPAGTTPVTVSYDADSTFDKDMRSVAFIVDDGEVEVYYRMPGDADGDGELDLMDVTNLSRYLAGGWDVTVDASSADVDGDGKLTLRDVVLIRRYLAGWDVELI